MKNCTVSVKDHKLTIVVDLKGDFGRSSTGKSIIVASSEGNSAVPDHDDIKFGLNVFKTLPKS